LPVMGRVEAAKLLGLESVPTVRLSHLSPAQRKAYVIADNKLALNAGWDREVLATELQGLIDIDFEVELTGFSLAEIDIVLDEARDGSPSGPAEADDEIPSLPDATAVTRKGDVWLLGRHRLICGASRDRTVFDLLMGNGRADLIFTDPPYNLPIDGHVCGLGRIRHREFAMGGVGAIGKSKGPTSGDGPRTVVAPGRQSPGQRPKRRSDRPHDRGSSDDSQPLDACSKG
jgi:hypothetical protein